MERALRELRDGRMFFYGDCFELKSPEVVQEIYWDEMRQQRLDFLENDGGTTKIQGNEGGEARRDSTTAT